MPANPELPNPFATSGAWTRTGVHLTLTGNPPGTLPPLPVNVRYQWSHSDGIQFYQQYVPTGITSVIPVSQQNFGGTFGFGILVSYGFEWVDGAIQRVDTYRNGVGIDQDFITVLGAWSGPTYPPFDGPGAPQALQLLQFPRTLYPQTQSTQHYRVGPDRIGHFAHFYGENATTPFIEMIFGVNYEMPPAPSPTELGFPAGSYLPVEEYTRARGSEYLYIIVYTQLPNYITRQAERVLGPLPDIPPILILGVPNGGGPPPGDEEEILLQAFAILRQKPIQFVWDWAAPLGETLFNREEIPQE